MIALVDAIDVLVVAIAIMTIISSVVLSYGQSVTINSYKVTNDHVTILGLIIRWFKQLIKYHACMIKCYSYS